MKELLFLGILILVVSTLPLQVSAQATTLPGNTTSNASAPLPLTDPFGCDPPTEGTPPCFIQVLQGFIGRFLLVVYPILAGMVFYGGLQMMFARGSSEKYKSGLRTIQYAVIGFVAIVLSQGIASILYSLLALGQTS